MKCIGIDYGEKRVGVAVSDAEGCMAFPRMVLPNDRKLMGDLCAFIQKENVTQVVVGESKARDGSDNPIMARIRMFGEELERTAQITVVYEPEFYSSSEARLLKEQAGSVERVVDAEAAAIILNSYLQRIHAEK